MVPKRRRWPREQKRVHLRERGKVGAGKKKLAAKGPMAMQERQSEGQGRNERREWKRHLLRTRRDRYERAAIARTLSGDGWSEERGKVRAEKFEPPTF